MIFKTKYELDEHVWAVECEVRYLREVWSVKGEGTVENIRVDYTKYSGVGCVPRISYGVAPLGYVATYQFPIIKDEYQLFSSQKKAAAFCKRRNIAYQKKIEKFEKDRDQYLNKFKGLRKAAIKKYKKLVKKETPKCTKSIKSLSGKKSPSKTKRTTRPRTRSKTSSRTKSK